MVVAEVDFEWTEYRHGSRSWGPFSKDINGEDVYFSPSCKDNKTVYLLDLTVPESDPNRSAAQGTYYARSLFGEIGDLISPGHEEGSQSFGFILTWDGVDGLDNFRNKSGDIVEQRDISLLMAAIDASKGSAAPKGSFPIPKNLQDKVTALAALYSGANAAATSEVGINTLVTRFNEIGEEDVTGRFNYSLLEHLDLKGDVEPSQIDERYKMIIETTHTYFTGHTKDDTTIIDTQNGDPVKTTKTR